MKEYLLELQELFGLNKLVALVENLYDNKLVCYDVLNDDYDDDHNDYDDYDGADDDRHQKRLDN